MAKKSMTARETRRKYRARSHRCQYVDPRSGKTRSPLRRFGLCRSTSVKKR